MFSNKKVAESSRFFCEKCNYITNKGFNYNKHLATAKHIKSTFSNPNVAENSFTIYACQNCEKEYSDKSGLWRHNKKCKSKNIQENEGLCKIQGSNC